MARVIQAVCVLKEGTGCKALEPVKKIGLTWLF